MPCDRDMIIILTLDRPGQGPIFLGTRGPTESARAPQSCTVQLCLIFCANLEVTVYDLEYIRGIDP
jgi:hypothetical protein